jgi:hypothetical protein
LAKRERRGAKMDYGEQTTGTRDEHYNLISVLYHALRGATSIRRQQFEIDGKQSRKVQA